MDFSEVSPETLERAKSCETPEEFLALAKSEGYDLSIDQLEDIVGAGDSWICSYECGDYVHPHCIILHRP